MEKKELYQPEIYRMIRCVVCSRGMHPAQEHLETKYGPMCDDICSSDHRSMMFRKVKINLIDSKKGLQSCQTTN